MGEFRCGPHAGAPAPTRQARALECSPETALTLVAREGEASPHTVGAFVFHSEPREHIWCYSFAGMSGGVASNSAFRLALSCSTAARSRSVVPAENDAAVCTGLNTDHSNGPPTATYLGSRVAQRSAVKDG